MPPSAERFRVGIVGYGAMGKRRHAAISNAPELELCAVADPEQRPDDSAVRWHSSAEALFEESLHAVFVCVPTYLAAPTTTRALERGLHVFCEKPPAVSALELEDVRRVEAAHPELLLGYGFNHRQHASVLRALGLVESGELGRVLFLRGVYAKSALTADQWRAQRATAGGGILLDQGIHLCDLLRLFGGEYTEVKSMKGIGPRSLGVEENAFALLRTADGVVATLHSSATEVRPRFRIEMGLEGGMITLDGILSGSGAYAPEVLSVVVPTGGTLHEDRETFTIDDSWSREVAQFSESLRKGMALGIPSSLEALRTMTLVDSIYAGDPRFATTD